MKIGIQNFQGITDYQEIELAPLTLIYGPNSAGKSTLVDAMKVGAELYEKGPSAMPVEWIHSSQSAAQSSENPSKTTLRFDDVQLEEYEWDHDWRDESGAQVSMSNSPEFLRVIEREIERRGDRRIRFSVQYGWLDMGGMSRLCEYRLDIDGEWAFEWQGLSNDEGDNSLRLKGHARINLRNPIINIIDTELAILKSSQWHIEYDKNEARFDDVIEKFKGSFSELFFDGYCLDINKWDSLANLVAAFVGAFSKIVSVNCRQYVVPPVREINSGSHVVGYVQRINPVGGVWSRISVAIMRKYFDDLANKNIGGAYLDEDDYFFSEGDIDLDEVNDYLSSPVLLDTGFCITGDIRFSASADALEKIFAASEENRMALLAELAEITVTPKLHDKRRGCDVAIHDVGAGISQVIPVLVASQYRNAHIQQPELHLHPKMQARIADVFIQQLNLVDNPNQQRYLLETHSELLVLRVLRRIRETCRADIKSKRFALTPDLVSVLYVDRSSQGVTTFKRLRISPEGEFLNRWPDGFFAERDAELFDDE